MKLLRPFAPVAAVAIVLLGIVPAFLSPRYRVERSIAIAAPPARIHALVGDLSRWDAWTPWKAADPTVETVVHVPAGVGARQTWTGESGDGALTVTASDPATGIAYDLTFDGGAIPSAGAIRYRPSGDSTEVTWSMDGTMPGWIGRYFALAMDRRVGPMFEDGLARLKAAAEAPPDDRADEE